MRIARIEVVLSYPLAVDKQIVIAGGSHIRAGFFDLFSKCKGFAEHGRRLELLIVAVGYPFSGPVGRSELGRFESGRFRSFANIPVLIPYRHVPIVAGMRFQGHIAGVRLQVIRRCPDADFRTGSKEVLLASFVFPGETGIFRIQTDRFAQVFGSQVHRNRKLVLTFTTYQREKGKRADQQSVFLSHILSDLIIVILLLRTAHRSGSGLSRRRLFRDGW